MSREPRGSDAVMAPTLDANAPVSISTHVGRKTARSDAVDMHVLSVHRARALGGEEENRFRDFAGFHIRRRAAARGRPHRRVDGAGADAVDAHAPLLRL